MFPEHHELKGLLDLEVKGEYEELITYLRKKSEERRLTSLDQSNDNRVNLYLEKVLVEEGVQAEG